MTEHRILTEARTVDFITDRDGVVGTLYLSKPMRFVGDADESARQLFELLDMRILKSGETITAMRTALEALSGGIAELRAYCVDHGLQSVWGGELYAEINQLRIEIAREALKE